MPAQYLDNFHLLLSGQARDGGLNNAANTRLMNSNEARVIHEGERAHDELAVHAVCHTSMARDRVAEILNLERAFQSRGEEATKGGNQGCKGRQG